MRALVGTTKKQIKTNKFSWIAFSATENEILIISITTCENLKCFEIMKVHWLKAARPNSSPFEQSLLLSFPLLRRRKGGSARIASTLWSRRSPNFWTSQSCFLSSNRFFQCERPFSDKTDGYNWARCTMKNQDGGEIWHIRLGYETVSWQHAAHIQ